MEFHFDACTYKTGCPVMSYPSRKPSAFYRRAFSPLCSYFFIFPQTFLFFQQSGFKTFPPNCVSSSWQKRRFSADCRQSAESLDLAAFLHSHELVIVSKCGFTYRSRSRPARTLGPLRWFPCSERSGFPVSTPGPHACWTPGSTPLF